MSYWSVLFLCLGVFALSTTLAGHAFKPDLHLSWWTVSGWVFYIFAILSWELGNK